MKQLFTLVLFTSFFLARLSAQDSSHTSKWRLSAAINLVTVPTYNIAGTDTGFNNSLSIGPSISLGNSSGFAISYSPRFVMGGPSKGLYMHAVSVGFSRYDLPVFDYAITYGHYFFTGNSSIPYTPLNNEIYGELSYKKAWLRPYLATGIGFGKNTATSSASTVSDIGVSAGVNHSFDWDSNSGDVSFSMIPGIGLNAGTNDYFSFLNITRYIGHSSKSVSYVKSGGSSGGIGRGRGRSGGSGSSTGGTSTTTTSQPGFGITNIQLNLESSIDINNLSIRPTVSVYIPVGNAASGNSTIAFWQLVFDYKF